jgi:DNA polymerase
MTIKEKKQQQLDTLYEPYKKCLQCPLGFLGRTHVVFGQGNPDAHLMIIGEAPGKEEDEQGIPFIGKSGKLLTKTLLALNIHRDDIFITNIVKCRPPQNRTPITIEISTCTKLLLFNQIHIIQPKVLCTLGTVATKALSNSKEKITNVRGKILTFQSIPIIPTYHPAYVARTNSKIEIFIQDIQKAHTLSLELSKKNKN